MRSTDWKNNWDKSAQENQDIRMISGWGNRTFQEMLFSINDIAKKLDLHQSDRLLDIGCGAGLFEIAFAHWVEILFGADYSREMVNVAQTNTRHYENVHIQQCNIKHLPFKNRSFNKVLVNSVIQYLDTSDELDTSMKELSRVTKTGGVIFISLIPSARTKQDFLEGYYRMGLPVDEIKRKIEINKNILWFFEIELQHDLKRFGFSDIILAKPCDNFQKKYYFDLIIKK